jgi:hypothetical protein
VKSLIEGEWLKDQLWVKRVVRARDAGIRFDLSFGRIAESQRTVETGHQRPLA